MTGPREFKPGDRVRVIGLHTGEFFGREGVIVAPDEHAAVIYVEGLGEAYFGVSALTHLPEEPTDAP